MGENKYFTYHVGRQKRAGLLRSASEEHDSYQEQQRISGVKAVSPWFSSGERRQEYTETFHGSEVDENCNSPIGRLDVWNDTDDHSPKEDLQSSRRVRHKSESILYQGGRMISKMAVIPPPLDILKKRTSVGHSHSSSQDEQGHLNSSGNIHDMKGSCENISSSKTYGSGTLFGASLGFIGSSDNLADIHAKM